jgi:hypothetical protein
MAGKRYIPLDELKGEKKLKLARTLSQIKVFLIDIDGTLRNDDNIIEKKYSCKNKRSPKSRH